MSHVHEDGTYPKPSDDVVARRLDDVVVLINLKTNRMFELNSTGARLWELIVAGSKDVEVRETMLREFDVSETELTTAIDSLTSWLVSEGLIGNGSGA